MKAKSGRMNEVSMRWPKTALLAVVFIYCAGDQVCARKTRGDRFEAAQKAYVLACKDGKPSKLEFELEADEDFYDIRQTIINPVIILKGWGRGPIALEIDGTPVRQGKHFRVGYEDSEDGTNLVLWLKLKSTKSIGVTLH